MAVPVIMPRQGQSVESCIIAKWYKKKGDKIEVGDPLFSYETDKASFEEEAKTSGILLEVFFTEGDDVPCLTTVCVIGNAGESTAQFGAPSEAPAATGNETPAAAQSQAPAAESQAPAAEAGSAVVAAPLMDAGELKISPRAKALAEKSGVDIRYAEPTGPYGRIIEQDVLKLKEAGVVFTGAAREEHLKADADRSITGTGLGGRITLGDLSRGAASAAAPTAAGTASAAGASAFEDVKLPNIRKVIAKAMHHSLSSTAQLTLNASFDATDVMEFRKKLKAGKDRLGLENITLNDIIIYAVSRTLLAHKDLNAHFLDDKMRYFTNANIGVAVDTDRGLMVPTLFNANLKSLNEISKEVKGLVKECQSGSINPDMLKDGTFTITNLGTLDIESFTPVLNPPQTGILGVNNIIQRAREEDGEITFYPAMGLSLTFDHRAVDGAPAARFLKDLKNNLENFSALLVR